MTATMTRLLRSGVRWSTDPAGEVTVGVREPDIFGHITLAGWRVRWWITAWRKGRVLASGRTWTRGGAWVEAIAAAHKPGILGGAR